MVCNRAHSVPHHNFRILRVRRRRDPKSRRAVIHASKYPFFTESTCSNSCEHRYRRVKCDEARPECKRCVKFGVECDGYPAATGKPRTSRQIRPRDHRSIVPLKAHPVIYAVQPARLFEDEQEGRCFRIYSSISRLHCARSSSEKAMG